MPLSARRIMRRPVHASAVGLPTRMVSTLLDCILPSLGLLVMIRTGALTLDAYRARPGIFTTDQILMRLYEHPHSLLYLPLAWMLLWTAFSLVTMGTVRTTIGKKIMRLTIRQASGSRATGVRMFARILASWLIPATLGLAYLWIVISPQRRGWHDVLSATWVVRDKSRSPPDSAFVDKRSKQVDQGSSVDTTDGDLP